MSNSESREPSYGCLFCMTGKEQILAEQIRKACPCVHAVVARRERMKTKQGQKYRENAVMIPSYVFFKASDELNPWKAFKGNSAIRLLTAVGSDHGWQLMGSDREFARLLFQYEGLFSFSKAYQEGNLIRVISGPLKDMEGRIAKVDKRGHSMQVRMTFNDREFPVWLGYDLVDARALSMG